MRKSCLLLCVLVLGFMSPGVFAEVEIEVGARPPAISAYGWLNSSPISLDELKGKVVVLDFWGTWCPPCWTWASQYAELDRKYAKKGLVLVSLTNEDLETASEFAAKNGMSWPLGAGCPSGEEFGVSEIPFAVVIGRDGLVAWRGHPDAGVEKAIEATLAGERATDEVADEDGEETFANPRRPGYFNANGRAVPFFNFYTGDDGGYIAVYTRDSENTAYSVGDGINVAGLIRVRGRYEGRIFIPLGYPPCDDETRNPFLLRLCDTFFPAHKGRMWTGGDTGGFILD